MNYQRPNSAAEIAAGLRAIADRLDCLGAVPLPNTWISVDIQPDGEEEAEIAAVDLIGTALYDKVGETHEMSGGSYHYIVRGCIAGIRVAAYTSVTSPAERELRAELARLRALVGQSTPDGEAVG